LSTFFFFEKKISPFLLFAKICEGLAKRVVPILQFFAKWGSLQNGVALLRVWVGAILSEHIEQVLHIIGQRCFELHQFIYCRVFEFERCGVERMAADERLLEGRFAPLQLPGIN